jgi:hypothetical protein
MKETPKIDTTHPVSIPSEWNNGSIQMATPPAKPLRGRNHARVRLLGKSCPATEKAVRKSFVKQLQDTEAIVVGEETGNGKYQEHFGTMGSQLPQSTDFDVRSDLYDAERAASPALSSLMALPGQEISDQGVSRSPSFLRIQSDGEIKMTGVDEKIVSSLQKPTSSSRPTPASKSGSTAKAERYLEYKDNEVGSCREHIESGWVSGEWGSFLEEI